MSGYAPVMCHVHVWGVGAQHYDWWRTRPQLYDTVTEEDGVEHMRAKLVRLPNRHHSNAMAIVLCKRDGNEPLKQMQVAWLPAKISDMFCALSSLKVYELTTFVYVRTSSYDQTSRKVEFKAKFLYSTDDGFHRELRPLLAALEVSFVSSGSTSSVAAAHVVPTQPSPPLFCQTELAIYEAATAPTGAPVASWCRRWLSGFELINMGIEVVRAVVAQLAAIAKRGGDRDFLVHDKSTMLTTHLQNWSATRVSLHPRVVRQLETIERHHEFVSSLPLLRLVHLIETEVTLEGILEMLHHFASAPECLPAPHLTDKGGSLFRLLERRRNRDGDKYFRIMRNRDEARRRAQCAIAALAVKP